jgi:hypothetical protein
MRASVRVENPRRAGCFVVDMGIDDEALGGVGSAGGHPRSLSSGDQPLTAPAVMPDTILRLKKMNRMSGGTVTRMMFMKSRLY